VNDALGWRALPPAAQLYVGTVIAVGAAEVVAFFPTSYPRPVLFVCLLVASCLASAWKVNLPIHLASGSTLSVSYAACLMALLLLGPRHAMIVAVVGVWTQCSFHVKRTYPVYRTVFSAAAEAITIIATGLVYTALGGRPEPADFAALAEPLVGTIVTYFVVNTGLVAAAIALSTGRTIWDVWREEFLWSGVSFIVAGTAGAAGAIVVQRGDHWLAILMIAPVYATYRTYQTFIGRLEDQKKHAAESQRLHQQAVEALAQVQQAERARDQFLAMVSHELRTPLNAMLGWADMLRSGRLEDARRQRACQAIFDSAKRQARLIDELLDIARITSGKLKLEPTMIELADVVRSAVDVVKPAVDAKRIQLTVDVDPAIGSMYGDGARLQQVAWNLLSNAVKFTPESGTIGVQLRRAGTLVEFVVIDNGEGIADDFLPSVFEPFRQADGSMTRRHGGLGLGLSIVRHIAEAHGGSVSVASRGKGHGATFTVRLPAVAARVESPQGAVDDRTVAHEGSAQALASLKGLRVLVVDDDEESVHVVAAHLEQHQAIVLTAASASDALALVERERIDVLLADVAMPNEDGYTLIRKVRTLSAPAAAIPAAALTAFTREEDRQQALAAGFQTHLAKPVDPNALVEAVARLGCVSVP
jgi:signal transduction histidine kinase/ActR/RegA family two-component response regulator